MVWTKAVKIFLVRSPSLPETDAQVVWLTMATLMVLQNQANGTGYDLVVEYAGRKACPCGHYGTGTSVFIRQCRRVFVRLTRPLAKLRQHAPGLIFSGKSCHRYLRARRFTMQTFQSVERLGILRLPFDGSPPLAFHTRTVPV